MTLQQYSLVKIIKLNREFTNDELSFDKRVPKVGDVATVVEVYRDPRLGYELECRGKDGITEWLVTFTTEDAEFELINNDT